MHEFHYSGNRAKIERAKKWNHWFIFDDWTCNETLVNATVNTQGVKSDIYLSAYDSLWLFGRELLKNLGTVYSTCIDISSFTLYWSSFIFRLNHIFLLARFSAGSNHFFMETSCYHNNASNKERVSSAWNIMLSCMLNAITILPIVKSLKTFVLIILLALVLLLNHWKMYTR